MAMHRAIAGLIAAALASPACAEALRYGRPADFRPFHYKHSPEQLRDLYSDDMMQRAAEEWRQLETINAKGPWKPTWESLDRHKAPEWFRDAKFGIAINWGLYSVPAWDQRREATSGTASRMYPDAYGMFMYGRKPNVEYHARTWGSDFHYDDFFPLFTAENYDPDALTELVREVGAKYLVPFSKHHDGVAWWASAWTKRSFVEMGPRRDLLTPLVKAARERNLKVVLYYTYLEYASALIGDDGKLTYPHRRRVSGYIPVRKYLDQYLVPLVKEMIDRFDPDGLWMDGEWMGTAEALRSRELAAYLYNKAHGRKEVVVNDRYGKGTRDVHGDTFSSEFHTTSSLEHPWDEIRSISHSYAFNHEDNEATVLSRTELVHMLIDTVYRNGNLLLILGPDRTGRISELQLDRVKALGHWLHLNGEAVYGTRVLPPHQQEGVCFTRSKDGRFAYAICTEWPGYGLRLRGVLAEPNATIRMIGVEQPLRWRQADGVLDIALPESLQDVDNRPGEHAWVVRIPMRPRVSLARSGFGAPVTLDTAGIGIDSVVYALDGSAPTPASAAYAKPLLLPPGTSTTVKARCVRDGKLVGATASADFVTSPAVPPKPDVHLDTLQAIAFTTGWRAKGVTTWKNVNCHGTPLRVQGQTFNRGVGMHAPGEIAFALNPEYARFVCRVGIDDRAAGAGSVRMKVYQDDAVLYDLPVVLTGRDGLWSIDVKLRRPAPPAPPSVLRLVFTDNGDGIHGDNVDLVDAGFVKRP